MRGKQIYIHIFPPDDATLLLKPLASKPIAATIPILLITTSGADPGKEMEELAEKTVGRGRSDIVPGLEDEGDYAGFDLF